MNPIKHYTPYYYLAKEKGTHTYHLFLLSHVIENSSMDFILGIKSDGSWNITCKNKNEDSNNRNIYIDGKHYTPGYFCFEEDIESIKKEIILHSYISNNGYTYYEESVILLKDAGRLPVFFEKGGNLAYNCPYVHLSKFLFSNIKFIPTILILLKGYTFIDDGEVINKIEGTNKIKEEKVNKEFATTIFLQKIPNSQELRILEPNRLEVNSSFFEDRDKIDSYFEARVVLLDNNHSSKECEMCKQRIKDGEDWRVAAAAIGADIIDNGKTRSNSINTIPTSGVFIDRL